MYVRRSGDRRGRIHLFWVLVSMETDGGGRIHFVLGLTEVSHLVGWLVGFCFDLVCVFVFFFMDGSLFLIFVRKN